MANFTAGTSFTDGVTNDVTAAKLNALIADAVPTSNLSLNSTTGTISEFSSGTGTAGTVAIGPSGDKNTGLFFPAADTIAFSEGGTESMRIDSSGNVGIGCTPTYRSDIETSANTIARFKSTDTSGGYINFSKGTTNVGFIGSSAPIIASTSSTDLGIRAEGSLVFATNTNTERLRIDSSGNVGVGTTSPSTKLHVASGNLRLDDNQYILWGGNTNGINGTNASNLLSFYTNSTERLRIDSSGRVGIGTTGPQKELQINATEPTIRLEESGAGSKRLELSVNSAAEAKIFANQSGGTLILGTVATERLRITSGGSVGLRTTSPDTDLHILQSAATSGGGLKIQENSSANKYYRTLYTDSNGIFRFNNGTNEATITLAGSFTNASDARLKKDIVDIKYGLDDVLETKPRSFRRVDVGGEHFGFIAQELALVIPEAVSGNPEVQLGIDYGSLVSIAFRAIQELKAENDSLKTRVAALEAA